jgi:hypothetical protein
LQGTQGPAGPSGPAGPTGPQGIQGPAGIGINFKGQVATLAALPANAAQGDAYLVQADDSLRVWDSGTSSWVNGGSIQGPQGPAGVAGPAGATGPQGPAGPQGPQGIQGPAGADGAIGPRGTGWFTGTGAPPATIPGAVDGDLYLDLLTGTVYQLGPIRVADLPAIGSAFQGGFYAGLISHTANGVATHALIVAPKTAGSLLNVAWKSANTTSAGTTSVYDGWANSEAMNNASHPAAQFCRSLNISGYDEGPKSVGGALRRQRLDQYPAGRLAAVDVIGRRSAARLAGDRHHPAGEPCGPDVPPGPRCRGCRGGRGAGVGGEIHGCWSR